MKIVIAHNRYQQAGGEDAVAAQEAALLESAGHVVLRYSRDNAEINSAAGLAAKVKLAKTTLWASDSKRDLAALLAAERPDVVHFHNTFPLISPAAYYACRDAGVPVVQTLHNYRLQCPAALFYREGRVCEECTQKKIPWPGVAHACYRNSRTQTAVVAGMLSFHRLIGTWGRCVDVYVALTNYAREKFIAGGLPAEKIVVKPNFVYPSPPAPETYKAENGEGEYALFVGRLSPEKGVEVMLDAWPRLTTKPRLKIVGDGPCSSLVDEAARNLPGVEWLGAMPKNKVVELMKNARALIFPSQWYEGFPMVIAEAYSVGLPVIASNLGGMSTLIDHGRTGLHFRAAEAGDLAAQIDWAFSHPRQMDEMRAEARREFDGRYNAARNYEELLKIYDLANRIAGARKNESEPTGEFHPEQQWYG